MMPIEEARLICQDVSSTLEQAYGKVQARLLLGFWAAAAWEKQAMDASPVDKLITLSGKDADKVAMYLGVTLPGRVVVRHGTEKMRTSRSYFVANCNTLGGSNISVVLEPSGFDPWPKLREIADAFAEASKVIAGSTIDFISIHRSTTMETLSYAQARKFYAQVVLAWTGWGALCLGRAYSEDEFPYFGPEVTVGVGKVAPNFDGLLVYRSDYMMILSRCAGKTLTRMLGTRPIRTPWDATGNVMVCEIYLQQRTRWVFDLAAAKLVEFIPSTRKPIILGV